jgi:LuxR family transcriptional regulator, maltose regulon positive regulatory protein
MFEIFPSLLITKLYIPHLRSSHIARDALLASLDAGLERKLILIAAAAGSGKTMLLADWSSQHLVSWLSLDEGDNDPSRFLSYLIAAVQTHHPHIGQELLVALQSPQPPPVENVLHSLVNQLADLSERLILVLDDYHVIENQVIHAALTFLLDHLPPQVTLVILTRADPPLPLARLRARNDLLELRAADLRFSAEETSNFFKQFNLSPEAVLALQARAEGWIAGLQLASIAMQALPGDKDSFIQNFTGSHRFILDYLIEEVLSRQPENVRRFLLQTSILRRLNGALCSAVAGDGQAMIEYLEKNNLFLVPLDQSRYWYRYHHLFADLLQARLQAEYPGAIKELHQSAAHWHEDNELPEEAIVYALAAEDFEYAAQLMTGPAAGVMRRGEVTTLLDWYGSFPRDFIRRYPRLGLQFGMAFALNGRWDEAETLLKGVENQDIGVRPEEALLLAYLVASYRQDAARLAEIAQTAANAHPDRITRLVLALVVSLGGDFRHACQLLAEAQEMSERDGDIPLALTALFHQCRFQVFLGNLHRAYELSRAALERVRDLGNAALPMATFAHVSLGRILIEWNDLENAVHHLSQAARLAELSGSVTGMVSSATMMLAEVMQAQGDSEGAAQTAAQAISFAERYDPPPEVNWLKTYQARIWLRQGSTAADWMRNPGNQQVSLFYPKNIERVTRAHALLNQRKTDEAVALLTALAAEPQNLLTVETLNLLALARQAQGDSLHALLTLEQALTLGEAENRVRAFLDLGYPMAKLLVRFCETHPGHEYARKLLATFPTQPDSAKQVDPLSERELDVLRLIVAGQSNEEIAQSLTLAVSTVKWYINTLYAKLHVKTRSQAIARTHELKLLV